MPLFTLKKLFIILLVFLPPLSNAPAKAEAQAQVQVQAAVQASAQTQARTQSPIPAQDLNPELQKLKHELSAETGDSLWITKAIHFSREIHKQHHQQEKEHEIAQKAIDRALKINDTLLYARALDNMGLLYRYHQWYTLAIPLHVKAFELIRDKEVPDLYKMIFANNVGLAARYNQQYDLSVSYYLNALKIASSKENLHNISISSNGLGNALSNIPGKENDAMVYFQRALNAEAEQNDSLGMAMNLLSISDHYIKKQQYDTALTHLNRLWVINEKRKDIFGMAITDEFYGHAYFEEGVHLEKANDYYLKSLGRFQKLHNTVKEAEILQSLGKVQSQFGHLSNALSYYNRSMRLADSMGNKMVIMENAYQISSIKEQLGQHDEALRYYKRAAGYEDSINIARQKIEIAALTNEFQLDKKETQIALLQKEKSLIEERISFQEEEIKTHRIYLVILLLGGALIILLINIQYRNKRAKRQAELALRKKEKSLLEAEYEKNIAQAEMLASRMQVNPHFIFNSLNAINLLIQKGETQKAGKYLITFSRFIRMVLETPKSQVIPLTEELKLIQHYLTLEEKRFNEDFDFQIDAVSAGDISDIKIPPLLLQPFVENAIWHGLLPAGSEHKQLIIKITKTDSAVKIVIDDNGVGRKNKVIKNENESKKSMGMKITQKRIDQFNKSYDCQINLAVIDKQNINETGTAVVLTIKNIAALTTIPV